MTDEVVASTWKPTDEPIGRGPRQRAQVRKAVVSGTLGSALEWFDFAIYGALSATVFPTLFFAGLGTFGSLTASFATFGVGFVARPLGAIVCGYLGDRYGRRPVLLATVIGMGAGSLAIAVLPAHQGPLVAVLLVTLRFIQGFSLGGESTGGQLMTLEHATSNQRGLFGALINSGSPLSQVLGNLCLVGLGAALTHEEFLSWGWRLPFLLSIVLVFAGVYIRMKVEETPVFLEQRDATDTERVNGLRVLRRRPGLVVKLILLRAGPNVTFYTMMVYGLSYLTTKGGLSQETSLVIVMVANAVAVVGGLTGGALGDRVGRKPVIAAGLLTQVAGIALFFPAAGTGITVLVAAVVTVAAIGVQVEFSQQPALFAEQFPTSMRFTGSALALTLSVVVFSAPAPIVAAAIASTGNYWLIVVIALVLLAVSLATVPLIRDRREVDLVDDEI